MEEHTPPMGASSQGVGRGRRQRVFIRINKIKEKIIYFYSLSVNYNNRSPAVGNDSQNGIHCCRQAAIIYELTNNILMNNNISRLYFIMTRTTLFNQKTVNYAADLLAILMAMRIRHGRSRATLDATGLRQRASIRPVLPQRTPWSSILA